MIETTINGRKYELEIEHGDETVVELLRGPLGLTGTKLACGTGACGACTVLVDGRPMASCLLPVQHIAGRKLQTVEAHGPGDLHPVQRAFMANDALQCGFCTPGMIMSAVDLVAKNPSPSETEIRHWLEGNICRCTGYHNIVKAVQAGAQAMGGQ